MRVSMNKKLKYEIPTSCTLLLETENAILDGSSEGFEDGGDMDKQRFFHGTDYFASL